MSFSLLFFNYQKMMIYRAHNMFIFVGPVGAANNFLMIKNYATIA